MDAKEKIQQHYLGTVLEQPAESSDKLLVVEFLRRELLGPDGPHHAMHPPKALIHVNQGTLTLTWEIVTCDPEITPEQFEDEAKRLVTQYLNSVGGAP